MRGEAEARLLGLLTVVFTDIVAAIEQAATVGDEVWRRTLDHHDELASRLLARFRGEHIKSTGDGVLAVFDGPARALRWAHAVAAGADELNLRIRAGVHTGEVERRGTDIGGIAVHIASRIVDLAQADEVLTSRAVRDLVAGSGISFAARGAHALKGVPDRWDLYAAV